MLHAARLTSIKGQRDLIAAAALANQEGALDDAVVILAGDAPGRDAYREELIGLVARHGLGDKVRLVGHCREMPAAYLAAQVAVTTSTVPETFGRTSAEAQAMGCPVIVPDLGALPERPSVSPAAKRGPVHRMALPPPRDVAALASRIGRRCASRCLRPNRDAIALDARGRMSRANSCLSLASCRCQGSTLAVYDELLSAAILAERFKPRVSPAELGA